MNVPQIYQDLEGKNLKKGKKVLILGTLMAASLYIVAGIFGYISFTDGSTEEELDKMFSNNILYAPYHVKDSNDTPIVIYVSLFGMMVVVMFATPFCVLPTKDSIEEVRNKKFSKKDNIIWTQILCWVSCALSLPFISITTPM